LYNRSVTTILFVPQTYPLDSPKARAVLQISHVTLCRDEQRDAISRKTMGCSQRSNATCILLELASTVGEHVPPVHRASKSVLKFDIVDADECKRSQNLGVVC
jgi:hypothetical protein